MMKLSKVLRYISMNAVVLFLLLSLMPSAFSQVTNTKQQILKNKADELVSSYQFEPAIEIYQEVLLENPGFANCYYNMAICYNELKQFDKAYQSLEKFIALKPKDSEAYFNMGIMQVYLGDDIKARTLLEKARALNPSTEIKQRIDDALAHLQPSTFPEEQLNAIEAYINSAKI